MIKESEVIIFDDAHFTGKTFHEMAAFVNSGSQRVFQYLTIVNRSKERFIDDGNISFFIETLVHLPGLRMWPDRDHCPLCQRGMPFSTSIEGGYREFSQHGQPSKK